MPSSKPGDPGSSEPPAPTSGPVVVRPRRSVVIAFLLLVTAGCLLVGELAVRIFDPQPTLSFLQKMVGSIWAESPITTITLKSSFQGIAPSQEFPGVDVPFSLNALGLRGPETSYEKPADTTRILCLGDSYTFGLFCADDEPYPRVVEQLLREQGHRIEVINAGYANGVSPDQHYAWLASVGRRFDPDIVLYGFFAGNDVEGTQPESWRELDERGLPLKIEGDDVYIDETGMLRSRAKDIRTEGDLWVYHTPILDNSHLAVAVARMFDRLRDWIRKRSPCYDVKAEALRGFGEIPFALMLEEKTPAYLAEREAAFLKLLPGMKARSEEMGAKFGIVFIPVNFEVEPHFLLEMSQDPDAKIKRNYFKELEPQLDEMGIPYVDVLTAMKAQPDRRCFPKNGEVHFNPEGHRLTAEEIVGRLNDWGWLDE